MHVIYRFARSADDFADEGNDPPETRLRNLGEFQANLVLISKGENPQNPLFEDLARIVRAHGLPLQLFSDLLGAFSQDVVKNRYADFAELLDYCRRSANPVGRLLLHLFHRSNPEACELSDRICSALQLINFWQDVGIDYAQRNRVYLPQDDMCRFGVTEDHLREQRCDRPFQDLMRFQVERARRMMLEGAPLGRILPGRVSLEIRTTMQGGLRVLEKLEHANFDMFGNRPSLKWLDWPIVLSRALTS